MIRAVVVMIFKKNLEGLAVMRKRVSKRVCAIRKIGMTHVRASES